MAEGSVEFASWIMICNNVWKAFTVFPQLNPRMLPLKIFPFSFNYYLSFIINFHFQSALEINRVLLYTFLKFYLNFMNTMDFTILIIDDNEDIVMMIGELLKFENYAVMKAYDGKEAMSVLSSNRIDLILLDVMLPDIDGRLLCKKLRYQYDMPIIMISAKDEIEDKVTGLNSGADDYMVKPFSKLELISRIEANLRRTKLQAKYRKKHLFIDSDEHKITRNNELIHLTLKEWDIIKFLLQHKGKLCPRETIISAIWGEDALYNWSRVLDVHIQHIREKIEDDPKDPLYIKTVTGVGYKIVI